MYQISFMFSHHPSSVWPVSKADLALDLLEARSSENFQYGMPLTNYIISLSVPPKYDISYCVLPVIRRVKNGRRDSVPTLIA
jgi:hypothetical protein